VAEVLLEEPLVLVEQVVEQMAFLPTPTETRELQIQVVVEAVHQIRLEEEVTRVAQAAPASSS